MPKGSLNVSLKGADDIFSTEESRQEQQREQVQQIPIGELFPFKNHPFKVLDDESMQRTVESVEQYGVLSPLIARPRPEGGYVTHYGEGEGLLFFGNVILPFVDHFPKDLELYRILTTRLSAVMVCSKSYRGRYAFPALAAASYPFVDLPSGDALRCKLFPADKFHKICYLFDRRCSIMK